MRKTFHKTAIHSSKMWLIIQVTALLLIFPLTANTICAHAKAVAVSTFPAEWFTLGATQARCHLKGMQIFVPDSLSKQNELAALGGDKYHIFGLQHYFMEKDQRTKGASAYFDYTNITFQLPGGTLVGTGGFMSPFVKGPAESLFTNNIPNDGGTVSFNGIPYPASTLFVVKNGVWSASRGDPSVAQFDIACEDKPLPAFSINLEIVSPNYGFFCSSDHSSLLDRICGSKNMREAQPNSGRKDLEVLTTIMRRHDSIGATTALPDMYLIGVSYNRDTDKWHYHNTEELPTGTALGKGYCRRDGYTHDGVVDVPGVYSGWARNHYTQIRATYCDRRNDIRATFMFDYNIQELHYGGGWRNNAFRNCPSIPLHVMCETPPSGFPKYYVVPLNSVAGVSSHVVVFSRCRATNPTWHPIAVDSSAQQLHVDSAVLSTIDLSADDSTILAGMDKPFVLGAIYSGRNRQYPFGTGNNDGDWMWYTRGTKMQTGFNNPSGVVGYSKWLSGEPKMTTASARYGAYVNSVFLVYNMKQGGWYATNTITSDMRLVCRMVSAPAIAPIKLIPPPANVAVGALSQLCAINGMSPFDATTGLLGEDLIIAISKSAGANDVILLGGRFTSSVYPPSLATGQWKHFNGAVFMTGQSLSTGATTTAYQNWVVAEQPAPIPSNNQEAGLALGYQQSAGGWLTVAVNAASVNRVACVSSSGGASSSESPAMALSKKLQFFSDVDQLTTPVGFGYADARCILADPTTRSISITNATVQAALEIAALANPSGVTADSLVLLPAAYDTDSDVWMWPVNGAAFTSKFSLEDGATADNTQQSQSWAVGHPQKSNGRNTAWFSLRNGGWVNSETAATGSRLIVCGTGYDAFRQGEFTLAAVTAPAGAATLADYPDQASILCEANTPSGVPHVITDDIGLQQFEVYLAQKAREGQLPTSATVIATNTRYSEAVEANLHVPWAVGYPKSPDTEEMLLAYDLTLKGFVNIPASTAEVTLACDVNGKDFDSAITIVHSDDYSSAGITAPKDSDETLIQVCALKDPQLAPVEVVYDGRQYELLVLQMRAALNGNDPYTITEPVLTGGRYVGGVWAWNNDANKNFATGLSGTAIRDSYIHWPSNFQSSADNAVLASDATTGYWSSVAGDSASFFVACMPASLASTYSHVVTAPPGLPAPNSPRNMSAALCMMNDPPGYPLIANDELTQRGLGESVRFALSQQLITADTNVLLVRASVSSAGETTWDTGVALNDIYTKWAPGNPDPDPALTMLAFSTSLGQWVNTDPSVAGTPYSLACETGAGDGSDGSSSLFKTGVFLVAVESTRSGRSSAAVKADSDIAAGWAACATHNGAPVQVLNATVDLEVQSIVIKELLNTSSTILSDASTPVLLGAYRDSASGEWGWVDPMQLTDKLTPFNYTNWVSEPAEGQNYSSFILSDGQWVSHNGAVTPTVAACAPYNYGLVVSPKPPVTGGGGGDGTGGGGEGGGTGTGGGENGGGGNGGGGGGNDPETGTDWSDPFAVCSLTGGVPLRVWNENVQNVLESSATSPDMPDVVLLGGEFAGDTFSGTWQWMVKSSDTGHGPAFTQNYALDSDPAAVPVDGAYAKWAAGYPKLSDTSESAPSSTILAYSKSAGGWVNVKPADGPYQVICTTTQGADDGYIAYPPQSEKKNKGFPWWAILIIVLVVVALLVILIIVLLCCCCCKKSDEYNHTAAETNDKLPEGLDKDIYYPPRDSEVPVANPLSPYVPADEAAPAKVREKHRSRQKRFKSRHAGTEIVDVNTDFMDQNTEIREDGDAAVFSPAEDVASNHSVEEI